MGGATFGLEWSSMPSFTRRARALGAASRQKERRRQYRTSDGIDGIRVAMAVPEQPPVQGELIDLSAGGAAVLMRRASSEDLAALATGADVRLTFDVPGIDPVPGIAAIVRSARDSDDGRVFGVEIVDGKTLHSRLPARVFAAFNRRRHFRLEFLEESAPEVEVQPLPDGAPIAGRLGNLSVSGCLLLFEPGHEPALESSLRVAFDLPGVDDRFSFHGIVRSAFEVKGSMRCGIEFDAKQSENFMAQEQQLSHFIVKRQQELRALK